ncbi:MAG: 3-hydroxybutyryl-CoA dehydrogenase [Alphaproteobacteria bacterium]|jgi:3-hydroxybutyryl-CoA dehydrogenase
MNIKKVGIIGAGQMGSGIAYVCALAGYNIIINDIDTTQLEKAQTIIAKNMDKAIKKQVITSDDKDNALKLIHVTPNIDMLHDCDLVIEAASEKEAIKKAIFEKLSQILKPQAYIVTNTSSISITRLASYTNRPEQFMGVHFMNPVPLMKLVELIKGIATNEAIITDMQAFITSIGKQYSQSEDYPGFIVNRILIPMINEAVYTLYEGVGSVQSIDDSMRLGANQPMGPLQLADLIGLDTCLSIMQVLYEGFSDTKYRPCPLLVKYVEAGWLGRKTKKGFYDYEA